jgi:hypothetical protein
MAWWRRHRRRACFGDLRSGEPMILCGRSYLVVTRAVSAAVSLILEERRRGVDGELGGQNRGE